MGSSSRQRPTPIPRQRDPPPSSTSSLGFSALSMRIVMASVTSEDYVQLVRVKGLRELALGGIPAIEAMFNYLGDFFQMQQAAMNGNFRLVQRI